MARVKGREAITFSVAPEILALADAHGQAEGLDRYDVLRQAITKGLLVMRIQREALLSPDSGYSQALIGLAAGYGDQAEHKRVIDSSLVSGLERDAPQGSKRKKVKPDAK